MKPCLQSYDVWVDIQQTLPGRITFPEWSAIMKQQGVLNLEKTREKLHEIYEAIILRI